jgi:hypothetical protein
MADWGDVEGTNLPLGATWRGIEAEEPQHDLGARPDKDAPQTLIVCLDDKIAVDFSKHVELTPKQIVVARDLAFDDTAAANLALQCRLKTI